MTALEVLWEAPAAGAVPDTDVAPGADPVQDADTAPERNSRRSLSEPASLVEFYGGPLPIPLRSDRPTIVANFVSTLDGVVSFGEPGAAGGSPVSGSFAPDHRLMGMLRAMADEVMVGAGTVRAARRGGWTPRDADPDLAGDYAQARRALGLAPQPTTVVVTASGRLDFDCHGLALPDVPVRVLTTARGLASLPAGVASERVQVVAAGEERVETGALITDLSASGSRLVVCEGGPHLLGRLIADGVIDELFLTVAPQVAGRAPDKERLALVEGKAFSVAGAPWGSLVSVRRSGSHLFLRYRFGPMP
jgi:riboflavin biosynthesis pyrimidine reductase